MLETFRLGPGGFRPLQTQLIAKSLVVSALAVGAAMFIVSRRTSLEIRQLAVIVPMLLLFVGFGIYRSVTRERAALVGSEWDVGDDFIRRRTPHRPTIEIRSDEITRIEAVRNGLVVRGRTSERAIWIPAWLEGFSALRTRLAGWQVGEIPVHRSSQSAMFFLVSIATIAAFATTFISSDPRVVVPVGLVLSASILYGFWYIRKSVHIDSRVKRSAWFVLMPALALLARVFSVLAR
jgi:hypothetical protein